MLVRSDIWAAVITIACLVPAAGYSESASDTNVFRNDLTQFEIRKPTSWLFDKTHAVAPESRPRATLNEKELQTALENISGVPIVIASKHAEPYDGLNPTFMVMVIPASPREAGKSALDLMNNFKQSISKHFAEFSLIEECHEVTISGKPGARMTYRYTDSTGDGREYSSQSTLVMVRSGNLIYQIALSAPPRGPDSLKHEVDDILNSMRFLD